MARNASDIFCLNEDNTDGNQMFSVHGSCPMRISRKTKPRENECFEYGRSRSPDKPEAPDRGDAAVADAPEPPPSDATLHRIEDDTKSQVSVSSMQRNPLTGAGMEIQEHKKSKKGPNNKDDRWVW